MKKYILKYLFKYKLKTIYTICLLVVENIIWLINTFINIDLTNSAIAGNGKEFIELLVYSIGLMIILLALKNYSKKEQFKLSEKCANEIREDYMKKFYIGFSAENLNKFGVYVSNVSSDISYLQSFAFEGFFNFVSSNISIFISLLGAVIVHWSFIIIFPITIAVSLVVPNLLSKKFQNAALKFSESKEYAIKKFTDFFSGADIIKRNNAKKFMLNMINKYGSRFERENFEYKRKTNFYHTIIGLSSIFSQFIYIVSTLFLVLFGYITVGAIVGLFNISQSIYSGVSQVFSQKAQMVSTYPIFEKLLNVNFIEDGQFEIKHIDKIEVRNLNFGYDDNVIFKNFNMKINRGDKVAIVGKSGSGKSTLIKLIMRELPSKHQIFYNGIEVNELRQKNIYDNVAIISQKPYLFNVSIKDNISLDFEIEDKKIKDILTQLKLEKFLSSDNLGIKNIISQNGQNISGGELQRLVIAREIIREKDVLIMDEGLSALDNETKNIIENFIFNNSNLTIISITHPRADDELDKYDYIIRI